MRPGTLHWALAAGVALAVHLAAFISGGAEQWRAAEQSASAPEAVWGLTEIALTEEVDPLQTATPAEPVEEAERLAPRETKALRAEAPAEQAQVAVPETAEPTEEKEEEKPVDKEAEQKPVEEQPEKPVEERQVQEPVEEPEETQLKEKPKKKPEKKKKTKKKATSSGPVGRTSGSNARRSSGSGRASFSNYAGRVAAHLRRYKRYPSSAGRASGTVRVSFSLSRDGALGSVRLVANSGNSALDRAAINMVRRANPFPAMPRGLNRRSARFTVPIRFSR